MYSLPTCMLDKGFTTQLGGSVSWERASCTEDIHMSFEPSGENIWPVISLKPKALLLHQPVNRYYGNQRRFLFPPSLHRFLRDGWVEIAL